MMKKAIFSLLAVAIVASLSGTVLAQESVVYFDIRDGVTGAGTYGSQLITAPKRPWTFGDGDALLPTPGIINGGGAGSGQVLRLSPTNSSGMQNNNAYGAAPLNDAWPNYDQDGLLSTGNLWLYMRVNGNSDTTPGVNDCISSLGIHLDGAQIQAGQRNQLSALSFQLFNSGVTGVPSGSPWNNKIDGVVGTLNPPSWTGAKAARVPVNTGPVYQANLGMTVSATPYRIGQLRATAGLRNCLITTPPNTNAHVKKSSFTIKIRNNNILTTRVFQSGGDASPAEQVAYGYTAAAPGGELANASGSVENATSATADATIQIRLKGDFNGDGSTDGTDTPDYLTALGVSPNHTVLTNYLFDFNHDRNIDPLDTAGYLNALGLSSSCP